MFRLLKRSRSFQNRRSPLRFLSPENGFLKNGCLRLGTAVRSQTRNEDRRGSLSRFIRTADQVFFLFFSILRFKTMSLRESKLDTVRVTDFAPSFSAWSS